MARRRHPHSIEHNILITATLCLLAAGAVMVFSASSARSVLSGQGDGTSFMVKYVAYGAVGFALMQVIARRGLELVVKATGPLLFGAFVCLVLVKVPGFGVSVNGARRWLGAGPLVFQPSEVAKLALVLYGAKFLAPKAGRLRTPRNVAPLLLVAGTMLLLIASQPDLGTALVIAFTLTALLVAAGMPVRYLAIGAGVGVFLVAVFALAEPYRRARLVTFLDPWSHADGAGFQAVQGQIAMGSGGLTGRGLGASIQKVFFLPEAHTDFILAVIGEELGVLGVWALLALYGMVGYAGLRTARTARGTYSALLAAGITSLILSQALLNIFAVLGLAPLTGVPLPFISSGSSSLLVVLAGMGLLLNVAGGGHAHIRSVPQGSRGRGRTDSHRGRRDGGSRRSGSGGRRRATG